MYRKLLKWVSFIISFVLLTYIISKIDLTRFIEILNNLNIRYLFIALIFFATTPFIQAFRWFQALNNKVGYFYLLRQTIISYFFNNLFLAFIGGDIYRAYKVRNKVGNADAVFSIFLTRLTNMWGAVLIPFPFILMTNFSLSDEFYRLSFLISLLCWGCTLFILIFNQKVLFLFKKISIRGNNFYNLSGTFVSGSKFNPFFSSFIFNFVNIVVHYFFAKALGIQINFIAFFVIIPSVLFLTSLPIAVNGIGVREGGFILALNFFLIIPEKSLALSLLSFSMSIFLGIMGGGLFLIDRMKIVDRKL